MIKKVKPITSHFRTKSWKRVMQTHCRCEYDATVQNLISYLIIPCLNDFRCDYILYANDDRQKDHTVMIVHYDYLCYN